MNTKKRKVDGAKIFSIVASLAIVVALVVGVISIVKTTSNNKNQNYIDLNVADNATTESNRATEIERETSVVAQNETTAVPETEPPVEPAAATETEAPVQVNAPVLSFNDSSNLLWPVDGEVILGYNMDNTIYFPTLDQYKCNPAIIISAEVGTEVLSSAPGVVEDIYEDPIIGTSMVVSVGDGYKLIYGQLSDLSVGISQTVEAGTVLGRIAEPTKYFNEEGSNLYFELEKDGTPIDPMLHLIENE